MKFVVFAEEGVWVAHGLERNMVAHGESLSEVSENAISLHNAYDAQGLTFRPLPAVRAYWLLYDLAGCSVGDYLFGSGSDNGVFRLDT